MSSGLRGAILTTMLVTGVILAPAVLADAATDLAGLKTVINAAANSIGGPTNETRNWGAGGSSGGNMGTADLVQNITQTVLGAKYNVDLNKVAWLNNTPVDPPAPPAPAVPTVTDLYLDYINTIPSLSVALTAAGRAWHWEMNAPVLSSIGVLQQTLSQFSNSLLEADVIDKLAILRTIKASNSLEDAQQAWSKILNLPGDTPAASKGSKKREVTEEGGVVIVGRQPHKFSIKVKGETYTHKELWGRRYRYSREALEREYNKVEWRKDDADAAKAPSRGAAGPFIA